MSKYIIDINSLVPKWKDMDFYDKLLYVWDKIDFARFKYIKNYWIFILENDLDVSYELRKYKNLMGV